MKQIITPLVALGTAALMLGAGPALAETLTFTANLSGDNEVPPNDSSGTGTAEVTYDTETMDMNWSFDYDDLTGPVVAAHFHGPAGIGENAPPMVPIEGDLTDTVSGTARLTEAQSQALIAGQMYLNLHTEQFPGGEVRGQVVEEGEGSELDNAAPASDSAAPADGEDAGGDGSVDAEVDAEVDAGVDADADGVDADVDVDGDIDADVVAD